MSTVSDVRACDVKSRGLIHYTLVPVDAVSTHFVRPSIPANMVNRDEGVMNETPTNGTIVSDLRLYHSYIRLIQHEGSCGYGSAHKYK